LSPNVLPSGKHRTAYLECLQDCTEASRSDRYRLRCRCQTRATLCRSAVVRPAEYRVQNPQLPSPYSSAHHCSSVEGLSGPQPFLLSPENPKIIAASGFHHDFHDEGWQGQICLFRTSDGVFFPRQRTAAYSLLIRSPQGRRINMLRAALCATRILLETT